MSWNELATGPGSGYAEITDYLVIWDQGTSNDVTQQTVTGTSAEITSGVSSGNTYVIKIQPQNVHGPGPESDPISIVASILPGQVDGLVTSMVPDTSRVELYWDIPALNGGTIDMYEVLVFTHTSSEYLTTAYCDGSDTTIRDNHKCEVEMADLITHGGYSLGQTILFTVRAHNENGWGDMSDPNTGDVVAQLIPQTAPDTPTGTSTKT